MVLDVIEHVMHVMHHVIDVITDPLQCITCCPLHYCHYMPLHACNVHVMGHVMDVITCITWWSLPLQSRYIQDEIHQYIQDVIHVITCPLHAPKDANAF